MTIRDILNVLFKRRYVVFGFFLAALVGGFVGLKVFPASYESTARLLVRIGQEDIYVPTLTSSQFRTPMMSVVREEQLHSEAGIITSEKLSEDVVDKLTPQVLFPGIDVIHPWYTPKGVMQMFTDLYQDIQSYFFPLSADRSLRSRAVARLQKDLSAEPVKSSNIIEVTLRSRSPDAAALGVNALVKNYLTERVRVYQREQTGFISEQLQVLNDELASTENKLERFRTEHQIVDVDVQRAQQMDKLRDLRKKIDETQIANAQTESELATIRQQLGKVPSTTQISESSNSYAVSELSKQLTDLKRQEADVVARLSDKDPAVRPLRDQIGAVEQQLAQQRTQRYAGSERGMNPLNTRLRDDQLRKQSELDGFREALTVMRQQEAAASARLDELDSAEAQYKQLVQHRDVLRDSRKLYYQRMEETRFLDQQAQAQIGNVSVINWAVPDHHPVSPKLWMVLLGVLLGGLVGGIGLAFVIEFLDDSLKTDADVRRYLELPVIAKVPQLI